MESISVQDIPRGTATAQAVGKMRNDKTWDESGKRNLAGAFCTQRRQHRWKRARPFFRKMYDSDTRIGVPSPKRKELFDLDPWQVWWDRPWRTSAVKGLGVVFHKMKRGQEERKLVEGYRN